MSTTKLGFAIRSWNVSGGPYVADLLFVKSLRDDTTEQGQLAVWNEQISKLFYEARHSSKYVEYCHTVANADQRTQVVRKALFAAKETKTKFLELNPDNGENAVTVGLLEDFPPSASAWPTTDITLTAKASLVFCFTLPPSIMEYMPCFCPSEQPNITGISMQNAVPPEMTKESVANLGWLLLRVAKSLPYGTDCQVHQAHMKKLLKELKDDNIMKNISVFVSDPANYLSARTTRILPEQDLI